jgi:hypothetical protein
LKELKLQLKEKDNEVKINEFKIRELKQFIPKPKRYAIPRYETPLPILEPLKEPRPKKPHPPRFSS